MRRASLHLHDSIGTLSAGQFCTSCLIPVRKIVPGGGGEGGSAPHALTPGQHPLQDCPDLSEFPVSTPGCHPGVSLSGWDFLLSTQILKGRLFAQIG